MPRGKKTNNLQRFLLAWPTLVVLLIVVVLVIIAAVNMYQTHRGTQEKVDRLQKDKTELLERKTAVSAAASDVSTDRGVEEEIREKFSVAQEGERVIVLVDDEDGEATSTAPEASWWRRTLDAIWPFN